MMIPTTTKFLKVGEKHGRYTILGIFKEDGKYPKYCHVQCDCGSPPRYVQNTSIRNGQAKSCGCLHKERVTKHGLWKDPLFKVWKAMCERCNDVNNKRYSRYGGRGISICERWTTVQNFIADMSKGYEKGLQLDRIDNNKNYSPDNCRWASSKTQTRNYSRNVVVEYEGRKQCLVDWSIEIGINYGTLWTRMQNGWSVKRMLTTPTKQ